MIKQFILSTVVLSLLVLSCGGGDPELRKEARESLTTQVSNPTINEPVVPAGPSTSIQFEESEYNFGTVEEGEIVDHVYTFTNSGDAPLLITNAKGSCGCTVPDWPKTAIAPGETGEIKVRLNTRGKKNNVRQSVTLTANTEPANTVIYIAGVVNPTGEAAPSVQANSN